MSPVGDGRQTAGADPDPVDTAGNSPLHLAVAEGESEVIWALLERQVDVNRINDKDESPVMIADRIGRKDLYTRLTMFGARRPIGNWEG